MFTHENTFMSKHFMFYAIYARLICRNVVFAADKKLKICKKNSSSRPGDMGVRLQNSRDQRIYLVLVHHPIARTYVGLNLDTSQFN
jgi:hypothetical protein